MSRFRMFITIAVLVTALVGLLVGSILVTGDPLTFLSRAASNVDVALVPSTTSVAPGGLINPNVFTVDVQLDPKGNQFTGAEIEINYPAKICSITNIHTGAYAPVVLEAPTFNNLDANGSNEFADIGTARFVVGVSPTSPQTIPGTLATITFAAPSEGACDITFNKLKTRTTVTSILGDFAITGYFDTTIDVTNNPEPTAPPTSTTPGNPSPTAPQTSPTTPQASPTAPTASGTPGISPTSPPGSTPIPTTGAGTTGVGTFSIGNTGDVEIQVKNARLQGAINPKTTQTVNAVATIDSVNIPAPIYRQFTLNFNSNTKRWDGVVKFDTPTGTNGSPILTGMSVNVKALNYMSKTICSTSPTELDEGTYLCGRERLTLSNTVPNVLDLTGILFPAGDPVDVNDITNALDYSYVINLLGKDRSKNPDLIEFYGSAVIGDFNMDGGINSIDLSLMRRAASTKGGQLPPASVEVFQQNISR